jgi:hypothetical protein
MADDTFSIGNLPDMAKKQIKAYTEIKTEPPEEIDYMHAVLCQVSMPRRTQKELVFKRSSGNCGVILEAGSLWMNGKFTQPELPYGSRPRIIMAHISSEAVRTKSKEIHIGDSMHGFMKALGINTGGREYARFRSQLYRLAACRMTIGFSIQELDGLRRDITVHTQPIHKFEAWLTPDPNQRVMWPGVLYLSDEFFNTLLEHAVPLDRRALNTLKHSALCLDIYCWLAHRLHRVTKREGVKLSWENLHFQFGQEYENRKDFKREFKRALRQALVVYPSAKIEGIYGGILLKQSPPPIPKPRIVVTRGEY